MATTPLFDFPLPSYFVDIKSLWNPSATTSFEVEQEGEVVTVEAPMLPAKPTTDRHYICFRYGDEPFTRALIGVPPPYRHRRPEMYDFDLALLQQRVEIMSLYSLHMILFLVDANQWGIPELYWLYLDNDLRSGTWISCEDAFKTGEFSIEARCPNFLTALDDPESDIRFVLYWMQLSRETQRSLKTFYERGDEEELQEVVRAIAFYEGPAPGDDELVYFNGFLESDWKRKNIAPGAPSRRYYLPYPAPTLRLEMWGKHVRNYFGIHGDAELTRKHPWLDPMQPLITIECSPPSQHERLEAALFLREWGRDKIPDTELRLLLPKL